MILKDYHVHTLFSDGKYPAEDMVLAAIERGMTEIGFSDHSFTSFDQGYCMSPDTTLEYKRTILKLREKYKDRISIKLGIEQDYESDFPAEGFDYIIGSVHFLKFGDEYVAVDDGADKYPYMVEKYFNGDYYALVEKFFETEADVVNRTGADIIGHFDLISLYNQEEHFFDENHPRYVAAWKKAVDALLKTDAVFEVNFGAYNRGRRNVPYPNPSIQEYIIQHGGKLIPDSDAHVTRFLCHDFEQFKYE